MLKTYLKRIKLDPSCYEWRSEVAALQAAMEAGLEGKTDGLEMIPTYVGTRWRDDLQQERTFLVLDAGGTNLRMAVVTFQEGKKNGEEVSESPRILHYAQKALPGTQGPIGAEAFMDELAALLLPHLAFSRRLAFCFSFSAEILPNREARVRGMAKEVQVTGMENLLLGEALRAALRRQGDTGELEVLVLNDTIAAALACLSETVHRGYEGPVGIIHGTGVNVAYPEPKLGMLVNTEAGNYRMKNRGPIDVMIDEDSRIPGDHAFEKMYSGAYLGEVFRLSLLGAAGLLENVPLDFLAEGERLLSEKTAKQLRSLDHVGNQELSLWLKKPSESRLQDFFTTAEDVRVARKIGEAVYARAARFVTMEIAASLLQAGLGRSAEKPAAVVIEGSTYYKSTGLRRQVEEAVLDILPRLFGLHAVLLEAPADANLLGSAGAWMTQPVS